MTKEDICTVLKTAREQQGMSQQRLADKAKTTKAFISRVENGKVNPGLDYVIAIANVLGLIIEFKPTIPTINEVINQQ